MKTVQNLPYVSFNASEMSSPHAIDAWREFFKGLFEIKENRQTDEKFNSQAKAYRVGQTILSQYEITANHTRRMQNRLKMFREELLSFRLYKSGSSSGQLGGESFEFAPDKLVLLDFRDDFHCLSDRVEYSSLSIPYSAIGYDPSIHACLLNFGAKTPVGRMLRFNLELLEDSLVAGSVNDATNVVEGFCGMLQGLVTRDLRDESVFRRSVQARAVAVRRYVDAHLRDPELDAAQVCNALGVSRPVLYRLFAVEGGFRRAIQNLRLDRSFDDLALCVPERGAIARISQYWCFFDQAHFTRLFRAAFGITPSDVLGSKLAVDLVKTKDRSSHIQSSNSAIKRWSDLLASGANHSPA